jgi:hypothetical protein
MHFNPNKKKHGVNWFKPNFRIEKLDLDQEFDLENWLKSRNKDFQNP